MSNNQHYGMLNDRFDGRSTRLRKLGYRYESIDGYGIAIFTAIRFGKRYAIPAATVMNADEIVWSDQLERAERFITEPSAT
jgi:hypothetical protein